MFANSGIRVPLWSTVNMTGGTLASAAGNGDGNGNYSLAGQINATSDSFGNPAAITATQVSLVANTVLNVTHGGAASPADLVVTSVISSLPSGNGLTLTGSGYTQFTGADTYNGGTLLPERHAAVVEAAAPRRWPAPGLLTVTEPRPFWISTASTPRWEGLNGGGTIDNVAGGGELRA